MPSPKRWRQIRIGTLLLSVAVGAPLLGSKLHDLLVFARAGTAYSAKVLCSSVLMAGLSPEQIKNEDLALGRSLIKTQINREMGQVTATALGGMVTAVAKRQGHLGCTLEGQHQALTPLPPQTRADISDPPIHSIPWALNSDASREPPTVNHARLEAAVLKAFSEPDPINRPQRTRAVVVVKDGWVIAERYADGIAPETPLIGWSMTKSLMHALIGIAVGDGLMSLDQPVPMPEWSNIDGDPRATITPLHLLQMNTGLAFDETSRNLSSDLVTMLTQVDDMAAFATRQPLVAVPGQRWAYASGTTAILSSTLRQVIDDDLSYWRFPSERLFKPLGMATAVLETDPSGTFVGSSFGWASARDWARFGQLYLQDGQWDGQRILPKGWVEQAQNKSRGSKRAYGSHWWINRGRRHRDLPRNSFSAEGYEGQMLLIIPSDQTVIVRLGQTPEPGKFDRNGFAASVLAALEA